MPDRLYQPLFGLAQYWEAKLVLASVGAAALQALEYVAALYGRMLDGDPLLVFLIVNLLVVDLVTGVAAARKRREKLHSKGLRRTGWKVIEYSAIGFVGVSLANGFADSSLHLLTDGLDDAALLYVAVTEAFSIAENIAGSRDGARKLIRRITDLATGRTRKIEEVVTEEPVPPPAEDAP